MVLGLVAALLTAQPVFEWVDEEGQSHFTNIEATIPEGVQRHELSFTEEPVVVGPSEDDARAPPPPANPAASDSDSCETAQQEVDALEAQLEDQQVQDQEQEERQARQCQEQLNLHGEGAWLRCRASSSDPDVPTPLQGELEDARETLRRAQLEGCR